MIGACERGRDDMVRQEDRAEHWWPMPVILATQEEEIRRITV
jgi:hypothetical protein